MQLQSETVVRSGNDKGAGCGWNVTPQDQGNRANDLQIAGDQPPVQLVDPGAGIVDGIKCLKDIAEITASLEGALVYAEVHLAPYNYQGGVGVTTTLRALYILGHTKTNDVSPAKNRVLELIAKRKAAVLDTVDAPTEPTEETPQSPAPANKEDSVTPTELTEETPQGAVPANKKKESVDVLIDALIEDSPQSPVPKPVKKKRIHIKGLD